MRRNDKRIWVEIIMSFQTGSQECVTLRVPGSRGCSGPITTDWNQKTRWRPNCCEWNLYHSRIPIVLLPFCEAAWQHLRFNYIFLFFMRTRKDRSRESFFRGTLEFVYFGGFVAKRIFFVVTWWLATNSCTRERFNRIVRTTKDRSRFHGIVSKICKKLRIYQAAGVKVFMESFGSLFASFRVLATAADLYMWSFYTFYIKQLNNSWKLLRLHLLDIMSLRTRINGFTAWVNLRLSPSGHFMHNILTDLLKGYNMKVLLESE